MEYYNQLILEGIINRRMLREVGGGGDETLQLASDAAVQKQQGSYAGYHPLGDTSRVVGGIAALSPDPSPKSSDYGRALDQMYYQRPVQYSRSDYMRAYQAYLEKEKERKRRMGG